MGKTGLLTITMEQDISKHYADVPETYVEVG